MERFLGDCSSALCYKAVPALQTGGESVFGVSQWAEGGVCGRSGVCMNLRLEDTIYRCEPQGVSERGKYESTAKTAFQPCDGTFQRESQEKVVEI